MLQSLKSFIANTAKNLNIETEKYEQTLQAMFRLLCLNIRIRLTIRALNVSKVTTANKNTIQGPVIQN